jgi:hypothetical protein
MQPTENAHVAGGKKSGRQATTQYILSVVIWRQYMAATNPQADLIAVLAHWWQQRKLPCHQPETRNPLTHTIKAMRSSAVGAAGGVIGMFDAMQERNSIYSPSMFCDPRGRLFGNLFM